MGRPPGAKQRGELEPLPPGSIRVKVYAGLDPVTKRRLYLTDTDHPGPTQAKLAEQLRTRFLNEIDEKRNPGPRATVDQLMVKYFDVLDVDALTKRGYRSKHNIHIKPVLGTTKLTRLDVEVLDCFYAELRRCRLHCRGNKFIQHRTTAPHQCDEQEGERLLAQQSPGLPTLTADVQAPRLQGPRRLNRVCCTGR